MDKIFIIILYYFYIINIILCEDKYFIRINNDTNNEFIFELKDTKAANELKKKLPFTVKMTNLNNNEIYYKFSNDFTKNEKSVGTINIGDIHLYKSDTLVLFYKTFSTSYKYTEIGKLVDTTGLETIIGNGEALVQWCLNKCSDEKLTSSFNKSNYLVLFGLILLLF